jgi:Response regulator receiver domain
MLLRALSLRFSRPSRSVKERGGLSMVYGFVRQSGGQARIYSELNNGTMVCLYLPRYYGDDEDIEQEAKITNALLSEHGEVVLVVDDEPTVRMLVGEILADLGYRTPEADDGNASLKILESNSHIDLLITDVGLPRGINGRQHRRCRLSASSWPQSSVHHRLCGKRCYRGRPFETRNACSDKTICSGGARKPHQEHHCVGLMPARKSTFRKSTPEDHQQRPIGPTKPVYEEDTLFKAYSSYHWVASFAHSPKP